MRDRISILIACEENEDRANILNSVSGQADFCVIGTEKDLPGLMIKSANFQPSVIILDMSLLCIPLEELVKIIRRRSPLTFIIAICENEDETFVCKAMKDGVSGVLLKKAGMGNIASVVKIASFGGYYISAPVAERIFGPQVVLSDFPPASSPKAAPSNPQPCFEPAGSILSRTERGIIVNIALGFSDSEIAGRLNFSTGTVRNYITAIKRKVNLKSRAQLAVYALACGFLGTDNINFLSRREGPFSHPD